MKKIFTFFLSTLMGCSLYAQESADRLVIFDKAQNQKKFLGRAYRQHLVQEN